MISHCWAGAAVKMGTNDDDDDDGGDDGVWRGWEQVTRDDDIFSVSMSLSDDCRDQAENWAGR